MKLIQLTDIMFRVYVDKVVRCEKFLIIANFHINAGLMMMMNFHIKTHRLIR